MSRALSPSPMKAQGPMPCIECALTLAHELHAAHLLAINGSPTDVAECDGFFKQAVMGLSL